MIDTRYRLAIERIRAFQSDQTVHRPYGDFFCQMSDFVLMLDELDGLIERGKYSELSHGQMEVWNRRLFEDIFPENYRRSYGNPAYAVQRMGEDRGRLLCFLYSELRGGIPYVFEREKEKLTIIFELLIETYNRFEEFKEPDDEILRNAMYWYVSDYSDLVLADYVRSQVDWEGGFLLSALKTRDFNDIRYLYSFGEYVSEDQVGVARYLGKLSEDKIESMARVLVEGYTMGFKNTGRDLSAKQSVDLMFRLGFERLARKTMEEFEKIGLKTVIYRTGHSVMTRKGNRKRGFFGGSANRQYEYDHKDDMALFLDRQMAERRIQILQTTYEAYRDMARGMAGPACMETFGEVPLSPVYQREAAHYNESQDEISRQSDNRSSKIVNQYIPGDERSFTVIAYPLPGVGEDFEAVFEEVVRINTLDSEMYSKIQQVIIDTLDRGSYVRVKGKGGNRTDLKIVLQAISDRERETVFENCAADVNIPVGEVFTTPRLAGTQGILNVGEVYLNGLKFADLEITFSDGMVSDYTCRNDGDSDGGRAYIRDNILNKHDTVPMGEFAIGTNTTAYRMARKYNIARRLPILIAEKMGPHFALGDTCYSFGEDIPVYNRDGKEMIARDNECSIKRKSGGEDAYFHCHTDITIPYDELESISVCGEEEVFIIRDGRFVLPGTESLNQPLDEKD